MEGADKEPGTVDSETSMETLTDKQVATAESTATPREEPVNPFAKTSLVQRTPPAAGKPSQPDVGAPAQTSELETRTPASRPTKRKALNSPEGSQDILRDLPANFATMLKQALADGEELFKMANDPPEEGRINNTRKDIKAKSLQVFKALKGLVSAIQSAPVLAGPIQPTQAYCVNASTQTVSPEEMRQEAARMDIRARIAGAKSFADLANLASGEWPRGALVHVKVDKKSIVTDAPMRLLIVAEKDGGDEGVLTMMESQFPTLRQGRDKLASGRIVVVRNEDSMTVDGEEDDPLQSDPRKLVIAVVQDPLDAPRMVETLLKALERVKKEYAGGEIALYLPKATANGLATKLSECCLTRTDLKATLCNRRKEPAKTGAERGSKTSPPPSSSRVVTLKSQGTSYADMFKNVTGCGVQPTALGVRIERVSQTRDGHMRITVKESRAGACRTFTQALEDKTNFEAKIITRMNAVVMRDLDESIKVDDIKKVLKDIVGDDAAEAEVSEPKASHAGGYSSVVRLPERARQLLLKKRRVRVGEWLVCRVSELITPDCCYLCLKPGHLSRTCPQKGSQRPPCYKCGKPGHLAEACVAEEEYCPTCKVAGHRATRMACPAFREEVNRVKTARTAGKPALKPSQNAPVVLPPKEVTENAWFKITNGKPVLQQEGPAGTPAVSNV